jgi:hypothetical protein
MRALPILSVLILAGCAQDAKLPPLDPSTLPPVEETRDWEDWGEDRTDVPPGGRIDRGQVVGEVLNAAGIRQAVSGTTLNGCYPNGERFAERLAADGVFYDASGGASTRLGEWYVGEDDTLCFRYPDRQQPACFAVSRSDDGLHFYQPDFSAYVASTRCPMRLGE